MENAETILVIILSSCLAIFLILAIIVAVKVIKILNQLKEISDKAEQIADKAETAAAFITKAAGPAMVGKLLASIAEMVGGKAKKRR